LLQMKLQHWYLRWASLKQAPQLVERSMGEQIFAIVASSVRASWLARYRLAGSRPTAERWSMRWANWVLAHRLEQLQMAEPRAANVESWVRVR
jgi:hypothetical protein